MISFSIVARARPILLGTLAAQRGLDLYRSLVDDDGELARQLLSYPVAGAHAVALPLRTAIARGMLLRAQDPANSAAIAETVTDRLEGKPVQTVQDDNVSRLRPPGRATCEASAPRHGGHRYGHADHS